MNKQQAGFTLIELVMVIVILGILAATAIPRYVDLSTQAAVASANGALGAARGATAINHSAKVAGVAVANRPAYDATNCAGGLIVDGACLLQAMETADGWSASGATITSTMNGTTYTITVSTAETATGMAVLTKSW